MGRNGNKGLEDAYIQTNGVEPLPRVPASWLVIGIVVLASVCSFIFGYLYALERVPKDTFIIEGAGERAPAVLGASSQKEEPVIVPAPAPAPEAQELTSGAYVASKSGTAYHLPSCPGAKQIKEENKVWFASKTDAELAGYKPAKNCKGI